MAGGPQDGTRPRLPQDPGELIAASSIGIVGLERDGTVVFVNDHLADLLDKSPAELVGLSVHDALHASHGGRECPFARARRAAAPVEIEGDSFSAADGGLVPVTWIAAPLRGESGVSIIVRDDSVQRARAVLDEAVREQGRADLARARQSVSDLEWLAELTQTLAATLDEGDAMMRLAHLLVPQMADAAIVDLHEGDGVIRRVGGVVAPHVGIDMEELLGRDDITHHVAASSTSSHTVLRGRIVRLDADQIYDPAVLGESSRTLLRELDAASLLIVPLVARARVVGAFILVRQPGSPPFDDLDVPLADDIARRAALAVDNARLYREQRDIAVQLQFALLPPSTSELPVGTAVRYLPARNRYRVGGDWYDQFRLPHDPDRTMLIIGDVAGHDLPAATSMAAIRNLLRGVAIATEQSCAGVLAAVDRNLESLGIHSSASAIVMTVEQADGGDWTLRWSNAGHLPPLLLLPDGTAELLDARHGPILGTRLNADRAEDNRRVPAGSTVVLYTDGLVETRGEDIDTGLEKLRSSAVTAAPLRSDPEQVLAELLVHNHTTDEDDTAILVCHLPAG